MSFNFFKSKWMPYKAAELRGTYGCASVLMRNLDCERHQTKGDIRFKDDFGAFLHEWLSAKWKEQKDSPEQMLAGSPWQWTVEIKGFSPVTLQVIYTHTAKVADMYSDTLDAIINALSSHRA